MKLIIWLCYVTSTSLCALKSQMPLRGLCRFYYQNQVAKLKMSNPCKWWTSVQDLTCNKTPNTLQAMAIELNGGDIQELANDINSFFAAIRSNLPWCLFCPSKCRYTKWLPSNSWNNGKSITSNRLQQIPWSWLNTLVVTSWLCWCTWETICSHIFCIHAGRFHSNWMDIGECNCFAQGVSP